MHATSFGARARRIVGVALAILALAMGGCTSSKQSRPKPNPPAPGRHAITYDDYSFKIDGKRTYLWSGEFQYFRLPSPPLWVDVLQKMKAAGFNTVSLYFDWGYHSAAPGKYDFRGIRDVDQLLKDAQQAGLYVIARPGPYINAEVDGGGLPGWLTTKDERNRSTDPAYLKYADEWLTRIDRIIARHQFTNGTGSVIAYQVENGTLPDTAGAREYLKHLEDKAHDDGITVPLTGNHGGAYDTGAGALDVDGPNAYPQTSGCTASDHWDGISGVAYDHPPGKPLYLPEVQGGALDGWGGTGYDKCAATVNEQFADVFYENNVALGATAQNVYPIAGGTSWGWLSRPENYTSYDYGAAIQETRQLTVKYDEDKLIGYFTQSVAPVTQTDRIAAAAPDNAAILDTARANPVTKTQFHVLRHADSTSTHVDTTHVALDFSAKPVDERRFTYDDRDPTLAYAGAWTHVSKRPSTARDYANSESISRTAGATLTVKFTGTAVRWIGSRTTNHGYADVSLDDAKPERIDTSGHQPRAVLFQQQGLADGPHVLKIVVVGGHGASSTDDYVAVDAIDVPPAAGPALTYPTVPQQPGTAITIAGRESKIIVANYRLGASQLQYSTSEIMTSARIGSRDVAVLYGTGGTDGETVLRYHGRPTVQASGGAVRTTWDARTGDLRLNYRHGGLIRVLISGGGAARPLLLLLADKTTAATFWRLDPTSGPVLVRGTHLLRTAAQRGDVLSLTGDNGSVPDIEVFTVAAHVLWNGQPVSTAATRLGGLAGSVPTAKPVTLPKLTGWRAQAESPEAEPAFDDTKWPVADKTASHSITPLATPRVLYADDYGFHTGNVWYRGRFRGTGHETGVHLVSDSGGPAQAFSAWLDGHFLGSSTTGTADFRFPAGMLTGNDVLAVLTVDMGHPEDHGSTNAAKAARGLAAVSLLGAPTTAIEWRLQGALGGEDEVDPVRGPLSTGGLFGERAGWQLPSFADDSWRPVRLPARILRAGVTWYRTQVPLHLPADQDTSVGLHFADDPGRKYRVLVFVNGWQLGNYVNYLGPQRDFPIPNGILDPQGQNTIALAVWNLDSTTGGVGKVSLVDYGSYASALNSG